MLHGHCHHNAPEFLSSQCSMARMSFIIFIFGCVGSSFLCEGDRDEPNKGGVVRKLQEFDGWMTGGATVRVQGEEQRRKANEGPVVSCVCCFCQRHVALRASDTEDRKSVV